MVGDGCGGGLVGGVWVVAVVGVPGAGKSTQARVLAAELGGVARSAGDWVRARAAAGDPAARETVHTGQAIPPELYRGFLDEVLTGPGPLILDGSPRDEHHVAVLAAALPPGAAVTGILLDLPPDQAAARVRTRPRVRADDEENVAAARVGIQVAGLPALISAFEERWPLGVVDAGAAPETVSAVVCRVAGVRSPGSPRAAGPPS